MPSLLDALIQRQGGRFPSGREFLDASVEQRRSGGLLGPPSPQRRQPPSILDSGPSGGGGVQVPAAAQSNAGGGLPANQPVQAGAQSAPAGPSGPGAAQQQRGLTTEEAIQLSRRQREAEEMGAESPDRGGPGQPGHQGGLSRLLVGNFSRREKQVFSKEERERLRQNALVTAGLAMLGAPQRASTAQVISRGLMAARQQSTESRAALVKENQLQRKAARIRTAIEDPNLSEREQWQQVRKIAAAQGDADLAELAQDAIEEMPERESEIMKLQNGQLAEVITKPDGSTEVRDVATGEIIRNTAGPPRSEEERLDRINSLSDDFRSAASDAQDVANAVNIGLDAPANAAGDVTLLTMLTRAIDPGVSVREADIRRGEQIGGVGERVQQAINTVASSGEMSEDQRRFIRNEIRRVGAAQQRAFQPVLEQFRQRAIDANVDPSLVIFDPFEVALNNSGGAAAGTGGASGGATAGGGAPAGGGGGQPPAVDLFPELGPGEDLFGDLGGDSGGGSQ